MTDAALPTSPQGYELIELIGSGEMGLVYRARILALDREAAVKVLHPRHRNSRRIAELFVREAQITASLIHPGVPSAFNLDPMPDGRPYFAMGLIDGRTLAGIVKEQGPVDRLLPVFESICKAVGYAHVCGVIHCDLEPSNIMIEVSGKVVVIDWGLAKVMPRRSVSVSMLDAGEAPVRFGSPAYMSPEQASGDMEAVDQRSDVFGLGAVLCKLLIGRPPYVGFDGLELRRQAVYAELDDSFRLLDHCEADRSLVQLCKRCLSANPNDRPSDATAVARELPR